MVLSPITAPPEGELSDSLFSNIYRVFNFTKVSRDKEDKRILDPAYCGDYGSAKMISFYEGVDYDGLSVINRSLEGMEEWSRRHDFEAGDKGAGHVVWFMVQV